MSSPKYNTIYKNTSIKRNKTTDIALITPDITKVPLIL